MLEFKPTILFCLLSSVSWFMTTIFWGFVADKTENACHGSDSSSSAARELEFFFPSNGPSRQNTAKFTDCTCCVIKPHAVKSGS